MTALELNDIQGNILRGYDFPCSAHLFARIKHAEAARRFLSTLAQEATTAVEWGPRKPDTTLNVALSYGALVALGLPDLELGGFPEAFRQGMAPRAERVLGDSLEQWEPFWREQSIHLWVSIHARSLTALKARTKRTQALGKASVEWCDYDLHGQQLDALTRAEHFGFRDGLTNPAIAGVDSDNVVGNGKLDRQGNWSRLAVGEFLLGHGDEADEIAGSSIPAALARNGTFVVLRKLHQNVAAFRDYVSRTAALFECDPDELAAKIVGRRRDGTPLVALDTPSDRTLNDFTYARDPQGSGCPLGAHVRRTNPRDAQGFSMLVDRHRLIRRGMPYGRPLAEGARDDEQRGLIFVALNADIERQFEFVQRHWVNDGASTRQGVDKDPLTGNQDPSAKMILQGDPAARRVPMICSELPRFVEVRGGEYFFMPGLRALRCIARSEAALGPTSESDQACTNESESAVVAL